MLMEIPGLYCIERERMSFDFYHPDFVFDNIIGKDYFFFETLNEMLSEIRKRTTYKFVYTFDSNTKDEVRIPVAEI
jgi:hypothetical protein